jgi:hypothetical protein
MAQARFLSCRAGLNSAGLVLAHLTWAKIFSIPWAVWVVARGGRGRLDKGRAGRIAPVMTTTPKGQVRFRLAWGGGGEGAVQR